MRKIALFLICLSAMQGLQGSDLNTFQNSNTVVLAIPGQNGLGSDLKYVRDVLNVKKNNIISVKTPTEWLKIDLGQKHCQKHLNDELQERSPAFIFATSQGTATAINALSQDTENKIAGLYLNAQLGSGNSAIHHTVFGFNGGFPGSRYLLPYLAKILFPSYSPSGMQAIKSARTITTKAPIIIAHSTLDQQLSINDARALYWLLRNNKCNAYLIEKQSQEHINVLGQKGYNFAANPLKECNDYTLVQNILKYHNVFTNNSSQLYDPSDYQPDHNQFKDAHDALVRQEKIHTRIGYGVNAGLAVGALYAGFKLAKKAGLLDPASPTPACA